MLRSRLSRNTLTMLVSNGGGALLSFALSVLIGRVLGQEGLGVYAATLAWVFPLWMLAEFGLETLITREVAQNPDSALEYLRAAAVARLGIGGGLALLLIVMAPLLTDNPLLTRGLQISAPLIVIGPFVSAFSAIFRAHQVMWPVAALNIGMLIVQVALTALVFLRGGGVLAALAVNTLTSAGQLVAAWSGYQLFFGYVGAIRESPLRIMSLLRRAWPFALAAVLAAIQMRLSVILLEQIVSSAEAGQFAAASRFVEAARLMPQALFVALFPALASLSENRPALDSLFRRVSFGLVGFGLLFAVGALLLGPLVIDLTYGPAFAPAVSVLAVLGLSLLPATLKGARILYCYAQGREQFVNRVTALVLLVQLGLSLWLVHQAGGVGVAWALLLSESLALGLLWWPLNKTS